MSTTSLRLLGAGAFFLLIFASGFWLSRAGKPYGVALFTVHKLIALAAVVLLGWTAWQAHQAAPLAPAQLAALAAALVCALVMFVSGGLLSIEKTMPPFVLLLHKVFPYLTLLFSSAALYLLLVEKTVS
jgi:hypothetical protein